MYKEVGILKIFKGLKSNKPKIYSSYGSTEIGGAMWATNEGQARDVKMKSVGSFTISPGYKYRIEDENGNDCPVGTVGEISALSPLRMLNYLKDKNENPATWVRNYQEKKSYNFFQVKNG